MAIRSAAGIAAAAMVLTAVPASGIGQPPARSLKADSESAGPGKKTGIFTSRLSWKELRTWRSVERVVFARDKSGRLLHPTLHGLWQEAERSGSSIYIEMRDLKDCSSNLAGGFLLEESGAPGEPPAAVIWLDVRAIDHASMSGRARRADGFMPFEGLRRKSHRYAEVLGHELVHALLALTDPRYASVCRELEREVAAQALHLRGRKENALDDEARARMHRIDQMSEELERLPDSIEFLVWQELSSGTHQRKANAYSR